MFLAAIVASVLAWGVLSGQSRRTTWPSNGRVPEFTPAHASFGEAVRHFFGIRPEPEQPIPFPHKTHIDRALLECDYCHDSVKKGPVANIPNINTCLECHETIATDKPLIQRILDYSNRGEDIPWQRVYGWVDEAHVRFNHAPHIRAQVECATCHGDVAQMTVARRVIDHTMGFCVKCHIEKKAPIDCLTCHF